ncbi:MAG: hypothetical protein JNL34_01760 [Anaerolineae bacterium]|nr:hypothetical protein [Anaerolineae bacterium]
MSEVWSSLYFRSGDAAAISESLAQAASAAGYNLFNPFSGAPGRSYPNAVRLFISPVRDGWVRVLGQPDPALLPAVSQSAPLVWTVLVGSATRVEAWANGAQGSVESIFGITPPDGDDLPAAGPVQTPAPTVFAALPADIQAMNANPKQAQAMLDKLSGGLLKKAGGDQAAAVAALQGNPPDWNSRDGRRLAALLTALGIPAWGNPDFVPLRDAYQVLSRLQRRPSAALYAGDREAMDAVPDALDYRPVYAGKG